MEPRSIIRWQHRLKREHPTCTERTKALIEECGWKGGDSGDSAGKKQRDQQIPKRIPLTPTGLLMEGVYTNYDPGALFSAVPKDRTLELERSGSARRAGLILAFTQSRPSTSL